MNLNPPRRVRAALYLLTALGTPVLAYLKAKGIIGDLELTLWAAEVTVVNGIAALNVSPSVDTSGLLKQIAENNRHLREQRKTLDSLDQTLNAAARRGARAGASARKTAK